MNGAKGSKVERKTGTFVRNVHCDSRNTRFQLLCTLCTMSRLFFKISREGISAIEDYVAKERAADFKKWKSLALFLSPATNAHGDSRLNSRVINTVFNEVCSLAGVEGHTPHDARHAMGRHLIEKTGNITAVQRQLGHTNAAYSIQYARVTDQELAEALDDR